MAPVAIGFTVFLAHLFLIAPTGCGINPARVFGSAVISGQWENQWLYWVGPFVGMCSGTFDDA
jgi:glycerol uptake facilitator-like aquaporin